jgi:hypothetical protein
MGQLLAVHYVGHGTPQNFHARRSKSRSYAPRIYHSGVPTTCTRDATFHLVIFSLYPWCMGIRSDSVGAAFEIFADAGRSKKRAQRHFETKARTFVTAG